MCQQECTRAVHDDGCVAARRKRPVACRVCDCVPKPSPSARLVFCIQRRQHFALSCIRSDPKGKRGSSARMTRRRLERVCFPKDVERRHAKHHLVRWEQVWQLRSPPELRSTEEQNEPRRACDRPCSFSSDDSSSTQHTTCLWHQQGCRAQTGALPRWSRGSPPARNLGQS